jgi:hypothetical protein
MSGGISRRRWWAIGLFAMLAASTGCARYRPARQSACQDRGTVPVSHSWWAASSDCDWPDLFPVPTQPVFPTQDAGLAAAPAAGNRQPVPLPSVPPPLPEPTLPPPPEPIPPPPPESAKAGKPAALKIRGTPAPAPQARLHKPSWVFNRPLSESVLRQMQSSVEVKIDPAAVAAPARR